MTTRISPAERRQNKRDARTQTIIKPLKVLGLDRIPEGRQYVTLCGALTEKGGTEIAPWSELRQMLDAGIIQPEQFHGIEKSPAIYEANRKALIKAFPDPAKRPHLHKGDICRVFSRMAADDDFRPAVINIDTEQGPARGISIMTDVLHELGSKAEGIEDVNVLLTTRDKVDLGGESLAEVIQRQARTAYWLDAGGWFVVPMSLRYQSSTIVMETVNLLRGKRGEYFEIAA